MLKKIHLISVKNTKIKWDCYTNTSLHLNYVIFCGAGVLFYFFLKTQIARLYWLHYSVFWEKEQGTRKCKNTPWHSSFPKHDRNFWTLRKRLSIHKAAVKILSLLAHLSEQSSGFLHSLLCAFLSRKNKILQNGFSLPDALFRHLQCPVKSISPQTCLYLDPWTTQVFHCRGAVA